MVDGIDREKVMPERRVWIAQCLCGPNRHCIVAVAGEAGTEREAEDILLPRLHRGLVELRQEGLNPWCGLCGSPETAWVYEVGRTPHRTMQEAGPALARAAIGNSVASALFGSHGPSRPKPN